MTDSDPDSPDPAGDKNSPDSDAAEGKIRVPDHVDQVQFTRFVTEIKNPEQQIGEHIIRALQHEDTVAVITTVAMGADGQQRVISAALNPNRLQQVEEILKAAEQERVEEEPCVGFHCLVKRKTE